MLAGSATKAAVSIGLGSEGPLGVGSWWGGGTTIARATVVAWASGWRDATGLRARRVPSLSPYFSIQARSVLRVMRSAFAVCEMFQPC